MPANNTKTTPRSSGRQTVTYRDTKGRLRDAVITGGSGTNRNLVVPWGGGATRTLTAVAKATSPKQTNVWFPKA